MVFSLSVYACSDKQSEKHGYVQLVRSCSIACSSLGGSFSMEFSRLAAVVAFDGVYKLAFWSEMRAASWMLANYRIITKRAD